jgi:uncharacterized protein (DUF302 family)
MYSFSKTITATMQQAEEKVRTALMEEGFGVLTEIDVQKVMKAKLDVDRSGYKILGACNPNLAHQAIQADPDIGLLLPCNVLIRDEGDGQIYIGFMDPVAVLGMVENDQIAEVAPQVREKLQRVADSL